MSTGPKKFEIFVNGSKKTWEKDAITYTEVVNLAYPGSHQNNEVFTVQYSKGERNSHGSLVDGQDVTVKSGMVFDVTRTVQS